MNLERVVPEARPIVEQAAEVFVRHAGEWFVGLIVHGSALKGEFVPGCSDVDLQLYLSDDGLSEGHLPLSSAEAIQRELALIDTAPFSYVQCYAFTNRPPEGWVGPVPGTYSVIAGRLPVLEATAEQLLASAHRGLSGLKKETPQYYNWLLEHGPGMLQRHVRLLCTNVWPRLKQVLTLQGSDPVAVWNMRKSEAIAMLPEASQMGERIRSFHQALFDYYPECSSLESGLRVFGDGVGFLDAVVAWWDEAGRWQQDGA